MLNIKLGQTDRGRNYKYYGDEIDPVEVIGCDGGSGLTTLRQDGTTIILTPYMLDELTELLERATLQNRS